MILPNPHLINCVYCKLNGDIAYTFTLSDFRNGTAWASVLRRDRLLLEMVSPCSFVVSLSDSTGAPKAAGLVVEFCIT